MSESNTYIYGRKVKETEEAFQCTEFRCSLLGNGHFFVIRPILSFWQSDGEEFLGWRTLWKISKGWDI